MGLPATIVGGGDEEVKSGRIALRVSSSPEVFCLQQRWWLPETHEESGLQGGAGNH